MTAKSIGLKIQQTFDFSGTVINPQQLAQQPAVPSYAIRTPAQSSVHAKFLWFLSELTSTSCPNPKILSGCAHTYWMTFGGPTQHHLIADGHPDTSWWSVVICLVSVILFHVNLIFDGSPEELGNKSATRSFRRPS
jgi:hypothetical protein